MSMQTAAIKTKRDGRERGTCSYPCPKCRGYSRVKETRKVDQSHTIKRTRVCLSKRCGHVFETREFAL